MTPEWWEGERLYLSQLRVVGDYRSDFVRMIKGANNLGGTLN